jgi:hypothetical protein
MLNKSDESGDSSLVSDFRGNRFNLSPLSMMLAIGLSYIAFIMLRWLPYIHSFLRAFIMKWCWIVLKAFSASIEMIKWFLCLHLLMCSIIFIDLQMLNYLCIPGWSQLGHGEWSFWYLVGFSLPLFYWGFLHWRSLRKLVYSSPFWMCPCLTLGWM